MIYLVHPRRLEMLPPLISLARILRAMGEDVVYLGLICSSETNRILDEMKIRYELYPYHPVAFRTSPFRNIGQKLTRRLLPYRKRMWLIKHLCNANLERDIIWTVEMEGAAILGDFGLKFGRRHIHSFYELGDESGSCLWGFNVEAFLHSATLIECEYNRAHIFQAEHTLPNTPFVLPNKPYGHPRRRHQVVSNEEAARVVKAWEGKLVFLYQGALQDDRGDLFVMIESLCRAHPDKVVAVMGRNTPIIQRLQQKYPNFSHVPFVPPPLHLEVTSHADVGLAYYKGGAVFGLSPLNPVYCAPNKIYEYSGYGIPILCNDIPGLRYSVGINGAGVCISHLNEQRVCESANEILTNYTHYSDCATKMFDSVDLEMRVREILASARNQDRR